MNEYISKTLTLTALTALLPMTGAASSSASRVVSEVAPEVVGIVRLLAAPTTFDGHLIAVDGIACFQGSDVGLYLSAEACEARVDTLAVGLAVSREIVQRREDYGDRSFVTVEGRFAATTPEEVILDSAFQIGRIRVEKMTVKQRPSRSRAPKVDELVPSSETARALLDMLAALKTAVAREDIAAVAKLLAAGDLLTPAVISEELLDPGSRLHWVVFASPHSLQKILQQIDPESSRLFQLRESENEEQSFLVCACIQERCPLQARASVATMLSGEGEVCLEANDTEDGIKWNVVPLSL